MKIKKVILLALATGLTMTGQSCFAHERERCLNLKDFFAAGLAGNLPARSDQASQSTALFNQSLGRFIASEYNASDYAYRLSRDASHIEDIVSISKDLKLGAEPVYTSLRLFCNKLNWAEIVDYTATEHTLYTLAHDLDPWLNPQAPVRGAAAHHKDLAKTAKEIEHAILTKLTDDFASFRTNPENVIHTLAKNVTKHAFARFVPLQLEDDLDMCNRLRTTVKRLAERSINKMMWDPHMWQSIKPSFISMGNSLVEMAQRKVLLHADDLDDLTGALTQRLCFFFEMYGSVLQPEVIDDFMYALDEKEFFFLELDEVDPCLTSKKELLRQHLAAAKTRSVARAHGIESDQLA